jgi:hypothetical protein
VWKHLPAAALLLVVFGIGAKTSTMLPADTPVITDYVRPEGGETLLYMATVRCVVDGYTLFG